MAIFSKRRLIIIGGNAAGMTAASRLLRLDSQSEAIILERSRYISYSICGATYYLEGLIPQAEDLLAFTPASARAERGIQVRTEWEATEILPGRREVHCRDLRSGLSERLSFDNLLVATGCQPATAGIAGADRPAVFKVSQLENIIDLNKFLQANRPRSAVVIGGGYIGLNTAEALMRRGLSVRVLERGDQLFPSVDGDIAAMIEQECIAHGIEITKFAAATEIVFQDERPSGVIAGDKFYPADVVLVDVGVVPNVDLAREAGLQIGTTGAIAVSPRMETSCGGIYAAGNCAEAIHRITGRPVISALGTHAVKQGRVAGENLAGIRSEFSGVLQTSITKFFSLSVSRTGLNEREAQRFGFDYSTVTVKTPARASYFPPGESVTVKLLFNRRDKTLLGAQIAGSPWTTKRIDVAAACITARLTLEEIAQLDLAYSPPHAPLWDPILVAANVGLREFR